jgi:hypothetical protein
LAGSAQLAVGGLFWLAVGGLSFPAFRFAQRILTSNKPRFCQSGWNKTRTNGERAGALCASIFAGSAHWMLNQRPCSLLISLNHTERTTGAPRLATGPLRIPSSVSEYYIDYRQSLFGVLTAKDCRNNYHTETLVGKPYWAWSGVFAEFPHLPVKDLGKGRLDNRRQKQLLEDVDLNININTCRTATRQLRELDGAKSEGNFEKLAHWCAFQRQGFKPGVGKNKKEGFGNCVWFADGTLVIIVRIQSYFYSNVHGRPCSRLYFDTVTFDPATVDSTEVTVLDLTPLLLCIILLRCSHNGL